MILVDANILLYASVSSFAQHRTANLWLTEHIQARTRVGIPWPCILAFLRIATNHRVLAYPMSTAAAWRVIGTLLSQPNVWIPAPTASHAAHLERLLALPGVGGNLVMDAHLAALAIEHGLTVFSADTDFAKFSSVRWVDPTASR